jgi:hypothetical protein
LAVCFCGTFPKVALAGRYPAPYFRGARTFLSPRTESGHPAVWQREIGAGGDEKSTHACEVRIISEKKVDDEATRR